MEFEHLFLRDTLLSLHKLGYDDRNQSFRSTMSSIDDIAEFNDPTLSRRIESFQIHENGTPKTDSADRKLSWLRSQVIGNTVEFDTPFGKRRLTYADHTASGRCLSPHKFLGGPGSPGILLMNKILYQLKSSPPSTLYVEDIEEREDAGTPPIIQKIRAALAFWVKEYIGHDTIDRWEHFYIEHALKRLLPNPNIEVLGNTTAKRQAVLSFLIYTTTYSTTADISPEGDTDGSDMTGLYLWRETGNKRDKPLHGPFVAKLLNDLFGIQARGGCACAGPYGHSLLKVDEYQSHAFRSAIEMVRKKLFLHLSKEEFEFTLGALEFLAIYGQRFLPLYHFNWKTGAWTFKKRATEALKGMENNCDFCFQSSHHTATYQKMLISNWLPSEFNCCLMA